MATLKQETLEPKEGLRAGLLSVYAIAGAVAGVGVLLLAASLFAAEWPWLPLAALLVVMVSVWCFQRPSRWLYLLIATLFLESNDVSLFLAGTRVRPAQVVLLPTFLFVALSAAGGLIRLRRIPLLWPLLLYLGCNYLSALLGAAAFQSLKISLLLTSLVVFYVVAYVLMDDDPAALRSLFRFFIFVGLLQIGYGLYQVAAGYANARFGLSLPIGALGMVHTDYLGTIFGRPYGSLPEPDTYGAVCLFYALFLGLMWLTPSSRPCSGQFVLVTATAAMAGLLIGFVRASWFGFFFGLVSAFAYMAFGRLRPLRAIRIVAIGGLTVLVLVGAWTASPELRRLLARRFDTGREAPEQSLSLENARIQQMIRSFRLFRQRPVLGNGPGSFTLYGTPGAHEEYHFEAGTDLARMYDPSIITTILNDTGLVGMGLFAVLAGAYFRYVRRRRHLLDPASRTMALSAHCALVGLFASFLFTHYFWMPFTWFFLAIVVMLHEIPLRHPNWWKAPSRQNADKAIAESR